MLVGKVQASMLTDGSCLDTQTVDRAHGMHSLIDPTNYLLQRQSLDMLPFKVCDSNIVFISDRSRVRPI